MARTVLPIQVGARETITPLGTLAAPLGGGTAIDQVNGMVVTPKRSHRLVLFIYNSAAGAHVYTIRAGIYPPAESMGQGDLVSASIPTVAFAIVTGLSGARFLQAGGAINIDFDAGTTGTIWAYEQPA